MFAVSVYVGWLAGIVLEIAAATLTLWYAFLAGAGIFSAFILAIEIFI